MVFVTISAAGKPPVVARGLPFTVEFPAKSIDQVTIEDVKSSIANKFPKVRDSSVQRRRKRTSFPVLRNAPKAFLQRVKGTPRN
jgi:hypothetical protein